MHEPSTLSTDVVSFTVQLCSNVNAFSNCKLLIKNAYVNFVILNINNSCPSNSIGQCILRLSIIALISNDCCSRCNS